MSNEDVGTRARLMEAAEALFAAKGFQKTSIREIAEAADANVAAVNYHFKDKENLYREIFATRARLLREQRTAALREAREKGEGSCLEGALRAFIRAHLVKMLSADGISRDVALFYREITNPGPCFDILIEEMVRPTHDAMVELLCSEVEGMTRRRATLCMASVMGQLIHFVRARKVIEAMLRKSYDEATVEELVEHVLRFSLAGMEASR